MTGFLENPLSDGKLKLFPSLLVFGCSIFVNTVSCKQCGKLIKVIPKRKPRKFCSDACRTAWWNSHQDCVHWKAVYEYTCAHCGKQFTAYGNARRKHWERSLNSPR